MSGLKNRNGKWEVQYVMPNVGLEAQLPVCCTHAPLQDGKTYPRDSDVQRFNKNLTQRSKVRYLGPPD